MTILRLSPNRLGLLSPLWPAEVFHYSPHVYLSSICRPALTSPTKTGSLRAFFAQTIFLKRGLFFQPTPRLYRVCNVSPFPFEWRERFLVTQVCRSSSSCHRAVGLFPFFETFFQDLWFACVKKRESKSIPVVSSGFVFPFPP